MEVDEEKTSKKIQILLLRSFGLGVTILSPKYNGLSIWVRIGCIEINFWSRGEEWIGFDNYWNYD